MSDADVVLRQIIVSLGGGCIGLLLIYAFWHVRARQPRPILTTMHMVATAGLAGLTTEHIYSHLLAENAPVWQLWGALVSFSMLAVALVSMIRNRESAVTKPAKGP